MRFYTNVQLVGNQFLVRGYDNGEHFAHREEYMPTLFVDSKNKKSKYKTLDGRTVEPVQPGYVKDCREFFSKYDGVEGFNIYGNERYIYQYISDKYPQEHIDFDISKIKLVTLDIETTAEQGFPDVQTCEEELLTITIQDYTTKQITTWGVKPFLVRQQNVTYIRCLDELDLLNKFITYWENEPPEVITGWNIQLFDIPYIAGRLRKVLGEKRMKRLSPWGLVTEKEVYIKGRQNKSIDIGGVTQLDYLDLYKKFTYTNQESYRLDHIALVELGQQKLDHSEFDTFKDFYNGNWQKFVEYNIKDVELVDRLEDKMKLIELALTMAYDAKVNFTDVFYQVRMWDAIIYNYLKKRNIVIPPKVGAQKDDKYAGAYVKEPVPGSYDWVVSFDLNSLYPHLIMQYNISPETLVDEPHPRCSVDKILSGTFIADGRYATAANGAMYRKDVRGFLPELMDKIYQERTIYKKKMLAAKQQNEKSPSKALEKEIARCNNIQMARKIQLNSAYGAIGNQYFRYYKLENAEAITLSGQASIRWIENKMNDYLNNLLKTEEEDYVIASDTDSIYLNLGPLVSKFFANKSSDKAAIVSILDKICQEKLEPFIERSYQELANYVSAYDQKMSMKRENIADRGIWTAKKRYILNVWDSEGVRYKEPKMKIMGLETARSSTPAYFRDKLYAAFKIIIGKTNDELIAFINDVRAETRERPYEEVAFPRGVNNLAKYRHPTEIYTKGTPIHVRGALLYNHYVKKHKIENKHQLIQEGEKIKFMYLKTPNPIHENCISFFGELPKEFGIEKYVDYQTQFEKSFLEPLKNVLQCIGWQHERTISIGSFFE